MGANRIDSIFMTSVWDFPRHSRVLVVDLLSSKTGE